MATELDAAHEIVGACVRWGVAVLDVRRVTKLEVFSDRGVTMHAPDERDDCEAEMSDRAPVQRATVDIRVVLAEALKPLGYTLGDERDGFIRLLSPALPRDTEVYFLQRRGTPPYAIAPLSKSVLTAVIHVEDALDATYNEFTHTLGIHVHPLRDIGSLPGELTTLAPKVAAARNALPAPERPAVPGRPEGYSVALVEEYARTEEDIKFEWAVGDILSFVHESVLRLGNSFTGKPVPDGVIFEGLQSALYDCKSKAGDRYDLGSGDADQQHRYLEIMNRLKASDGVIPRGVLVFAPSIAEAEFVAKMRKEFWRRIPDRGLQLLLVQAAALKKVYELIQREGPSFRTFFQTATFWAALWDRKLPGIHTESDEALIFPAARTGGARLLTTSDLEVAWLAGLIAKSKVAWALGDALNPTAPGEGLRERARRPMILRGYFEARGRKKTASIASVAAELDLSEPAVRYLALQDENDDATADEWGTYGIENMKRFRAELRKA